jgi:hypothetical protein
MLQCTDLKLALLRQAVMACAGPRATPVLSRELMDEYAALSEVLG